MKLQYRSKRRGFHFYVQGQVTNKLFKKILEMYYIVIKEDDLSQSNFLQPK